MTSPGDLLVVDDDPDMVELLLGVLEHAGYEARSASNGMEALAAVAEHRPALVLLDMLMPIMDGWACARELRGLYGPDLKIIVVTAAEHARAWAEEVGADGVLPKPFKLGELLQLVTRYVEEADP